MQQENNEPSVENAPNQQVAPSTVFTPGQETAAVNTNETQPLVVPTTETPSVPPVPTPTFEAPAAPQPTAPVSVTPPQFTPPAQPTAFAAPNMNGGTPLPGQKPSRKKLILLAAIVAPLLLIGGSAAAYLGVVLPNKPENVFKRALVNTLEQKHFTFDGTIDSSPVDSSKSGASAASSVAFKGSSDAEKQTVQANVDVTISGIKVPAEVRYIDKTAYIKLGDLSTVKSFVSAYSPSYAALVDKVSNQWIEVDKTLISQAGADCVLDTSYVLTKDDVNLITDAYGKNSFATIKSSTSDKVNNKAATKFEVSLDGTKLAAFGKSFDDISFIKKLKNCDAAKNALKDSSNDESVKGKTQPVTIWVDKATRRISKIALSSTDANATKNNTKFNASFTLGYDAVTVEKPTGAKPLMSFIAELTGSNSGASGTSGSLFEQLNASLLPKND